MRGCRRPPRRTHSSTTRTRGRAAWPTAPRATGTPSPARAPTRTRRRERAPTRRRGRRCRSSGPAGRARASPRSRPGSSSRPGPAAARPRPPSRSRRSSPARWRRPASAAAGAAAVGPAARRLRGAAARRQRCSAASTAGAVRTGRDAIDSRTHRRASSPSTPSGGANLAVARRRPGAWCASTRGAAAQLGIVGRTSPRGAPMSDIQRRPGRRAGGEVRPQRPRHAPRVRRGVRHPARHCPVFHSDAWGGFWVASRYEDVYEVGRDPERFASGEGVLVPPMGHGRPLKPMEADAPEHAAYRRLLLPSFAPAQVAKMEAEVRALAASLVDERRRRRRGRPVRDARRSPCRC